MAGAIYLDYESEPDFSGRHNIIYGHNMKNGSMFKDIVKYKDCLSLIHIYSIDSGQITPEFLKSFLQYRLISPYNSILLKNFTILH